MKRKRVCGGGGDANNKIENGERGREEKRKGCQQQHKRERERESNVKEEIRDNLSSSASCN